MNKFANVIPHELVFDSRTLTSRKSADWVTITRLLKLFSQMYVQPQLSIGDT